MEETLVRVFPRGLTILVRCCWSFSCLGAEAPSRRRPCRPPPAKAGGSPLLVRVGVFSCLGELPALAARSQTNAFVCFSPGAEGVFSVLSMISCWRSSLASKRLTKPALFSTPAARREPRPPGRANRRLFLHRSGSSGRANLLVSRRFTLRVVFFKHVLFLPRCGSTGATAQAAGRKPMRYSTVTLLARLRGLSTSQPRSTAM